MNSKRLKAIIALLIAFSAIAAACSDDDGGSEDPPNTEIDGDSTTTAGESEGDGAEGQAVFVASQWPECTNPITSCAGEAWLSWIATGHVLPRLMELDVDGNHVPSPVLAGEPEVVESEDGSFTVTYEISPDAVWNDGTPITSADVAFTLEAILGTRGSLSTTGYDLISEIDSSDPAVAVLKFDEPYAPWADLFGGGTDFFIKADEFDSPDVSAEMNEGITFSGGPWMLESFNQEQAILVPNENYWDQDRMPKIAEVVFVPRDDPETQITALQSNEASVAFPEPFPGINDTVDGLEMTVAPGPFTEGLWLNQQSPNSNNVLESVNVRKALLYALDRQELADTALSFMEEGGIVLNCAGWNPAYGEWCDESDFGDIEQDFDMVETLLEEDGWTRGEGDECWSKDGEELNIEITSTAGNKTREDIQQVMQEQTREAGICFTVNNVGPGRLFNNLLPTLGYGPIGLLSGSSSPDPTVTFLYRSDQIPTEENEFGGQNINAYDNPEIDTLLDEADATVDPEKRLELVREIGDTVAEDVVWIPLYVYPNSVIWDPEVIEGPIDEYAAHYYSAFNNMYDWELVN